MDNGKRITKSILKNRQGTTLVEIMITVGLAGILTIGLLMITKTKTSLTKESAEKYSSIMSLMLPIKKLKRDISLATEVSVPTPDQLKITTRVIRDGKLDTVDIIYMNNQKCKDGILGKSAYANGTPPPREAVSKINYVSCLIRKNNSATPPTIVKFLGISAAKWCKGGKIDGSNDGINDCLDKTELVTGQKNGVPTALTLPEEYLNPTLQNKDLSKRRFMAIFTDRKNRKIAMTIDLGNLYNEDLKDSVQIAR